MAKRLGQLPNGTGSPDAPSTNSSEPLARDTMTYLFDKQKAMTALTAMEEQWGGTLAERMQRQADAWNAKRAAAAKAPPTATA